MGLWIPFLSGFVCVHGGWRGGEGEGEDLPRKLNLAQGAVLPFALGFRLVHSLLPATALYGHGRTNGCPDLPPPGWGGHTQQPGRPHAPQNHSPEARRVLVPDPACASPGPRGRPVRTAPHALGQALSLS